MNAKDELLGVFFDKSKIKCAKIWLGDVWADEQPKKLITLRVGYTAEEYQLFLSELDFEYDSGYGGQELFGNVWLDDDTWLERGEYDGSEWWEHKVLPEIPEEL